MVAILVEPAGALLKRSLELRGNTLEPYSCEVLAAYAGQKLAAMGQKVEVYCCPDPDKSKRQEPTCYPRRGSSWQPTVVIHVLQHGRKSERDYALAKTIVALLGEEEGPHVVGFSVRTYAYKKSLVLAALVKSLAQDKLKHGDRLQIVLGGYHPSIACGWNREVRDRWSEAVPEDFLNPVDYQVIGEGEKPLTALLAKLLEIQTDRIKAELLLDDVALVASLPADPPSLGKPHEIGGDDWRLREDEFCDPDLPQAVRDYKLITEWCRNWNLSYPSPPKQTGAFQVQFTRGCSYNECSFCCTPYVFGKAGVRHRNAGSLVREVKEIRDCGANFAYFNDVTFNSKDGEWREFCKRMIVEGLHTPHRVDSEDGEKHLALESLRSDDIDRWLNDGVELLEQEGARLDIEGENCSDNLHWFALCRGDRIPTRDALLLASAGCSKVGIGMESPHPAVVGRLGKSSDAENHREDIETSLRSTDKVGIINRVYIILGSPEETLESFQALWQALKELSIDQIRVAFHVPYVTPDIGKDSLLEGLEWTDLNEDAPNIKIPHFAEELEKMEAFACSESDEVDPLPLYGAVEAAMDADPGDVRLRSFLVNFRRDLIEGFYQSVFYGERVRKKVERYPHLRESYNAFFDELFVTSQCAIDIRHCLKTNKGE